MLLLTSSGIIKVKFVLKEFLSLIIPIIQAGEILKDRNLSTIKYLWKQGECKVPGGVLV